MLILMLITWERNYSIASKNIHNASNLCSIFSLIIILIHYAGQTALAKWLPDIVLIMEGLGPIKTTKEWIPFIASIGVFCSSTLYGNQPILEIKDTQIEQNISTTENDQILEIRQPLIEKVEDLPNEDKLDSVQVANDEALVNKQSLDVKDSKEQDKTDSDVEPIVSSVVNLAKKVRKLIISTPFGIMLLLRAYMMIWSIRYNTSMSIILICWNYYSICYRNISCFFAVTPFLLLPAVSIQILGTKFVEIPLMVERVIPKEYTKYLHVAGCIRFRSDNTVTPEIEYIITLVGLLLICATLRMRQYVNNYNSWLAEIEKNKKKPNVLEIVARFILEHTEKLYVIVLYLISLNGLNVIHTLILGFFFLFTLSKRIARKGFALIIIIIGIRSISRYVLLALHIIEIKFDSKVYYLLHVIGIEFEYNKSAVIYKIGSDLELFVMYCCSFLQQRILNYIEDNPFDSIPINTETSFAKFATWLNYLFKTYLFWVIYFLFLLILTIQNCSIVIQGYTILVVAIMAVHIGRDIDNNDGIGYSKTTLFWGLLALWNTVILLGSYIFYFVWFTLDYNFETDVATLHFFKIVGLDLTQGENTKLQMVFLPQFIILYLSFIARENILSKSKNESNKEVKYKTRVWMWLIYLIDIISKYSFHMLFLSVGMMAIFWSFNFVMLSCLAVLTIHYSVLHYKFVKHIKVTTDATFDYQTQKQIIEEECQKQKAYTISQCRLTLRCLLILASISLLVAQVFPFIQAYKIYIDQFMPGSESSDVMHFMEMLEALGCFLGMVGKEDLATPRMELLFTYIFLLCLCAIESHALHWFENRKGYTFVRVFHDESKLSAFEMFKLMLLKCSVDSAQKIRYELVMAVIFKAAIEYLLVGLFLFSVTGKNNVLEILFIPIAFACICCKVTLKMSWFISTYMWFWFLVQYGTFVITITNQSIPQELDNTIIIKAFHLNDWPLYKVIPGLTHNWAYYLTIESETDTRHFFMLDIILLIMQSIYFQHFCHSFYTLSNCMNDEDDKLELEEANKTYILEKKPSTFLLLVYKVAKNILVIYSHIFTLFCLLVMTCATEGGINLLYLLFSVIFTQLDLFNNIGRDSWSLPGFFRYVLKPFIFLDLTVQFLYQIPYFIETLDPSIMSCIGIFNVNNSSFSIFTKTAIFALILYQDAIYSSKNYNKICKEERRMILRMQKRRMMCMTLLYNNNKVHNFQLQNAKITKTHTELSMLKTRIERWNEVLHRKESKAMADVESGLLIDIEDVIQKLDQFKRKLETVNKYSERALEHISIIEKFYLWMYTNVNGVLFMNEEKLDALEKQLATGVHFLPNPVIDYHVKVYREIKKEKMEIEKLKLQALNIRLNKKDSQEEWPVLPLARSVGNGQNDQAKRQYGTLGLIKKIIGLLVKFIFSSTQELCFILMIIAHIFNGNLLSLIYVMSLFFYGMIWKCRPHRIYWKVMRGYSGFVIVLKYGCVFLESLLNIVSTTEWIEPLQSKCGWRIGLFEGRKRGSLYFLIFDVLTLLGIIIHMYVLKVLGLENDSEEDLESTSQATERIAQHNPQLEKPKWTSETKTEVKNAVTLIEEEKDDDFIRNNKINNTVLDAKDLYISQEKFREVKFEEEKKEELKGNIEPEKKFSSRSIFGSSFGRNLFPMFKNEKPGVDYNVVMTTIQLILCVYVIVFCSNMTYDVTSIEKIKISEFSGLTVILLLAQIVLILIERYIYSKRSLLSNTPNEIKPIKSLTSLEDLYYANYKTPNKALFARYIFHIFQFLLINFLVFWFFPNTSGMKINGNLECTKEDILAGQCNEVPCNFFLIAFYVLYCVYFWLSALQIRYGWPEMEDKSLMQSTGIIGKTIIQIFYAIPFAWELQQVVSWMCTETSFDIFQWLKFEEIYGKLFIIKCTSKGRRSILMGKKVPPFMKYAMGGGLLFVLIFLIIVPIIAFSSLNPMVDFNNPTKASFSITLAYETKSFQFMTISDALIEDMTNHAKDLTMLKSFKELRGAENNQFRHLTFENSSDSYLFPTGVKLKDLTTYFTKLNTLPKFILKYTFMRPAPISKQEVELRFETTIDDEEILANFRNFFNSSSAIMDFSITFPKFFCRTIILPLEDVPKPVDGWMNSSVTSYDLILNFTMSSVLKESSRNVLAFNVESMGKDLDLFVISEKSRTSFLAGYSIITLYVSVVLVAGGMIRGIFSGAYYRIMYEDMPNPSPLLKLCNGVEVVRYENNLIEESKLYWVLIEVLRSNELIKLITKTSDEIFVFESNDEIRDNDFLYKSN